MKKPLELHVNGRVYRVECEPGARLLDVLRRDCGLTGTKEGCGVGECGSCSVLVDGRVFCSCLLLAHAVTGREIVTIEGLADADRGLHPIQRAFVETGACQCGFCIPGMIIAAKALLDENSDPTDEEIIEGLAGNLCRCTGYVKIFEAVRLAAERMSQGHPRESGAGKTTHGR
jgi:carbon-monoxide dehydrogenase small subunit